MFFPYEGADRLLILFADVGEPDALPIRVDPDDARRGFDRHF